MQVTKLENSKNTSKKQSKNQKQHEESGKETNTIQEDGTRTRAK